MTELKQQNTKNPDLQENFIIDDLTQKIQSISEDINQLKKWLNTLTIDQQNEEIDIIEKTISECLDELTNLEIDGESSIDKKQLEELKIQIDKLTESKENIKEEIKVQTSESLNELNQTVSQSELQSDLNQNRWWKTKSFVSEQWKDIFNKEKWKEESWKNVLRTAGFVATGVWAISLLVWLWKRIFGKKDDIEDDEKKDEKKDEENQKKKSRKEKRAERRKKRREKRQERRENRPWRQKFLIWSAIVWWTAVWWVQVYKHWNKIKWRFKDILWLNLNFDEAKEKVESEVRNWINEDNKFWNFYANFEWIDYNKDTQIISSYWEETKIDYKNKKIDWLDIEFPEREQLIHAANLINFAKRKLKWRWANESPFNVITWWDLSFNLSWEWNTAVISTSDTNLRANILWIWWAVAGWLLGWYCAGIKWAAIWAASWWVAWWAWWAIIDENSSLQKMCDCLKKWKNLDLFVNYLNSQKDEGWKSLWVAHDQELEQDNITPIHVYLNEVIKEIEDSYWNWEEDSTRRNLRIEFDESNPEKVLISSYWHKTYLTLEWCTARQWDIWIDFSKITKIHIEKYDENDRGDWLDIDFSHDEEWLKESIRVINLTNKIREDWSHKWGENYPFYWWKYSTPPCLDFNSKWFRWHTILNRSTIKERFPILFEDLQKWENWGLRAAFDIDTHKYQEKMHNQSNDDLDEWSQYIKYLHQMTGWTGQKWYWKDNS